MLNNLTVRPILISVLNNIGMFDKWFLNVVSAYFYHIIFQQQLYSQFENKKNAVHEINQA